MEPLVSVIITTYQGMDNLDRAIKSVLNQTYKNIELIVVDDNGRGSDAQIQTEQIVKKYDGIVYISHEVNKNGSAARNTGIAAAQGEYIALLDDDDAYRDEKIEKQVILMQKENSEICYTGLLIHFSDGRLVEQVQDISGMIHREVLMRRIHAPSSVLMFKADAAKKINGFDESFRRHQDWEFLDRISYGNRISVVNNVCLDRYILKRNSAKDSDKYANNRLYYLEKMDNYLKQLSQNDYRMIIAKHYSDISREYLKSKKIEKALHYILKSRYPLSCIYRIFSKE